MMPNRVSPTREFVRFASPTDCYDARTKHGPADLAVLGGPMAFAEPQHVGKPNLPPRDAFFTTVNEILDRNWLTNNGPVVREFEMRIQALLGVRHCIATDNGTSALAIASRGLGLRGEVIVPSLTFIATPHALAWQGITPVFADINPETCCIDPQHVEQLITPRTTAILGVHLWGRSCEIEVLQEIANRHDIKLLFDASHAFGCTHERKKIGSFGDAETFSFHATKCMSAIEGGAVTTNDDHLADRLRQLRNFGFTTAGEVSEVGINAKMNEVCAAFGLASLNSFSEVVNINRRNFTSYAKLLSSVSGITLLTFPAENSNNYQYVVIRVDQARSGISRDDLQAILRTENVLARRYFYPGCHRSEPYLSNDISLPITDVLCGQVLSLPTGTAVTDQDVAVICSVISTVVSHPEIARHYLSNSDCSPGDNSVTK